MKPLHHSSGCFEVFLNAQNGKMPKTFYTDQVAKMGKEKCLQNHGMDYAPFT
jgi:hypothetical protein